MDEKDLQMITELKSKAIIYRMYCLASQLRDAERELLRVLNDKVSEKILNSIHKSQP